ncbi:Hypothetical predicted protein [Mytilus galloprovincialis]|uniref:DUF5641 domain-containing protein n=1 Tax=Mytilus galloprovincialis TaxID=29158 RepID=A0A8B6HFT1_MYTGA|nr:Hypothetical predicted protein [Mytilus galloprovincialis]
MPLIPPLPKNRVTESSPYTYTGIDYFGPLYVKTVNGSEKVLIGDIVLIKDNLPRGMWKIGKIINLSKSSDEQCRSAKVLLPSKKTLNRTLNFLYPLECHDNNVEQTDNVNNVEQNSKCETQTSFTRPQRRAAKQAKQKIHEWTSS